MYLFKYVHMHGSVNNLEQQHILFVSELCTRMGPGSLTATPFRPCCQAPSTTVLKHSETFPGTVWPLSEVILETRKKSGQLNQ